MRNNENPLITFIMTPQCTDSDVDYLQRFDETQINKYTLKELCKLMKRKAEELEEIANARIELEQKGEENE